MSETHLHGHFYRCDDCLETFDDKGTEHRCEGSREEILDRLWAAEAARDAMMQERDAILNYADALKDALDCTIRGGKLVDISAKLVAARAALARFRELITQ